MTRRRIKHCSGEFGSLSLIKRPNFRLHIGSEHTSHGWYPKKSAACRPLAGVTGMSAKAAATTKLRQAGFADENT